MINNPGHTLPALPEEELLAFGEETRRFAAGEISPAEYRAFRVPKGIYEQREDGKYMMRIRLPAGILYPGQMRALAKVSRERGDGALHITTRQDIQVHRVALEDLRPALGELFSAGLSTLGGGGNTVRNIVACHASGVCSAEVFDTAPWAAALTAFLLPDPASFRLPRKFKISFSGCPADCCGATVNDVGFVARERDGRRGFAVYVGGGMGARPRVADLLEPFIPAESAHLTAEAIKRIFDKRGNRKNKHKARLRFLIEEIGLCKFKELYEIELNELKRVAPAPLAQVELPARCSGPQPTDGIKPEDGFEAWRARFVAPQKQAGFHIVNIPLRLGDISADALDALADVVERRGERSARAAIRQNLAIQWVGRDELPALFGELKNLGLAGAPDAPPANIAACAGASTCRLGICRSRGLADAIDRELRRAGLPAAAGTLDVNISGCPNSCGRHPVADIGLFGAARRVNGRLAPHYIVQLGGRAAEGETRFAQGDEAVPARFVPAVVTGIFRAFHDSAHFPDFENFLVAEGRIVAERLISENRNMPDFETDKNFYYDFGADELFSLEGRGPGECGAGVFDMIEVDLEGARAALREGLVYQAAALSARALLITRGLEARDDASAFALFDEHFITAGHISATFHELVAKGQQKASGANGEAFDVGSESVAAFVDSVVGLYERLDQSLQLPQPETGVAQTSSAGGFQTALHVREEAVPVADRELDLRAVACPLNYVKTRIALEQLDPGGVLAALLNDKGAKNVPASAQQDGYEVINVAEHDGAWKALFRKPADSGGV